MRTSCVSNLALAERLYGPLAHVERRGLEATKSASLRSRRRSVRFAALNFRPPPVRKSKFLEMGLKLECRSGLI
eukprot:5489975-Pleurochrysis_carterae.AAC.1